MNIKQIFIFTIATAGLAVFTGCKKDFLETQPTEFTTPEQLSAAAKQDPKLYDGTLNGLYTTMFTPGVGGTDGHDDFGQKGIDIYSDMLSSDMAMRHLNYGWYGPIVRLQATVDFTRNGDYIPWRYYYREIYGANSIIDNLGGTDAVPETQDFKVSMGQAKTMRAYGYFYLTQLYNTEYGDGNEKILPIYTTANIEKQNQPKSTAKEVWDLMVSDLTQAITYLDGYTRDSKSQVDINVAKGLLAYVLAARGTTEDWTQVAALCKDITDAYPKTTPEELVYDGTNGGLTGTAGFNNVKTPSWMWGTDLTLAQGINLISWWGQMDIFTYSYAGVGDAKIIDQGLYDKIPEEDLRKGQFVDAFGDGNYEAANKFFDPYREFFGQRDVITDLLYMRSDEFYLLYCEAEAHIGQEDVAKTALKDYLSDRITDVSYIDALSGQPLLDEIYLQTRIELWGEGKSYFAMKRNKATITRGANHLFFAGESFQYNDPKLTFVIPQPEELNNPNLNK